MKIYRQIYLIVLPMSLLGCHPENEFPVHDTAKNVSTAIDISPTEAQQLLLHPPILEQDLFSIRIGVDHDPTAQETGVDQLICTDYQGRSFPFCYDEHDGSDYMLTGGFHQMDNGSATIVAAADGIVVATDDGHYDRCHGDSTTFTVSCDGHPMQANYVIIQHNNGYRTLYWHMKKHSVAVQVGQSVLAGTPLGKVGSSGHSMQPHLHFELQDPDNNAIDPYAGPYSQEKSWWCDQQDPFPGDCSSP